jgi:apolipoprotein N-acyltransferase
VPESSAAKSANNFLPAACAVAATAALLFWGTGLHPLWYLTWFAPLPVLLIAPRLGGWSAFLIAALAWFVGSLNMWYYLLTNFATLPLVLIFSLVPACLFGLSVVLFRMFLRRGDLWTAALFFPAFWVALEYLNNVTSPNGTFPNMGYTQMDCLPVLQLASLTGIWGIGFCLFLLPAAIAVADSGQGRAVERRRLAGAVALMLAAVVGYGYWRLVATPVPESSVKVGLMATGVGTTFPRTDSAALELFRDYADKSATLAAEGAQNIILPEKIAVVSDSAASQVDAIFTAASARTHAAYLVGLDRGTVSKRFNEARLYSSDSVAIYDKHHMVPVLENVDQPGTNIAVIGKTGIEICKDLDFPALSRQYGAKGVGLLLVPAWDFTLDGWLHGRMAIMRGVESGFTIVRAAKQGFLTVSDDRGRILAQREDATVPLASLVATAPVHHDDTLYLLWGDWFAWLDIAGVLALLVAAAGHSLKRDSHQKFRLVLIAA